MKVTYRREIKHNFMIVDPEEIAWESLESRMLRNNTVDGLLWMQIRQTEDGVRFYYDITSKQPLDRLLEAKKWRTGQIRSLLIGIFGTLERMERYLLDESHIWLSPEYIYVDPDTFRIWLCLVPGMNRDFLEDFGKLLERILECVDHQDKESVILAYGIYQETRKENYGIEDIMCLVRESGGREDRVRKSGDRDRRKQEDENIYENSDAAGSSGTRDRDDRRENLNVRCQREVSEPPQVSHTVRPEILERDISYKKTQKGRIQEKNRSEKASPGLFLTILRFLKLIKPFQEECDSTVQVPWEMMFREEEPAEKTSSVTSGYERPIVGEAISDGTNQAEYRDEWQGTVLLADLTDRKACRRLRALDAGMEDIPIPYYPFIIGKQDNLVDYKMDYETISRLHLRIDRENDRYFLQDLNSTNGTMLRGELLENNETKEIFVRDEICIAHYRFLFE